MGKLLFVLGTDTGVGKTECAATVIGGLRSHGLKVRAVKPVESGCRREEGILVPADAVRLWSAGGREGSLDEVVFHRLELAVTPAIAAAEEGVAISLPYIAKRIVAAALDCDLVVVEGAGGFLSPVAGDETFAELMLACAEFGAQSGVDVPAALVVAGSKLGVLNHTALTLEALLRRGIPVAGVVVNQGVAIDETIDGPATLRNIEALRRIANHYGSALIGSMPRRQSSFSDREWYENSEISAMLYRLACLVQVPQGQGNIKESQV